MIKVNLIRAEQYTGRNTYTCVECGKTVTRQFTATNANVCSRCVGSGNVTTEAGKRLVELARLRHNRASAKWKSRHPDDAPNRYQRERSGILEQRKLERNNESEKIAERKRQDYQINKTNILAKQKKYYNTVKTTAKYQDRARTSYLKYNYGLSSEEYDEILVTQNGVCAICNGLNVDERRLSVDHDHITGSVRGILCNDCNRALGCFDDDIERLREALVWVEEKDTKPRQKAPAVERIPGRRMSQREIRLRYNYGLTESEYDVMLISQNRRCGICQKTYSGRRTVTCLVVDHDHTTGVIRGLLCDRCNIGLGLLKDNPDNLVSAANYLQKTLRKEEV